MRICSQIKADGTRCRAAAIRNSQWCVAHDPSKAEANRRRSSRGGKAGGRGRASGELRTLHARLVDLADGVESGLVDRQIGIAVAQILNGARACIRDLLVAREQEELIQEVAEIKRDLEADRERRRRYGG